MSGIVIATVYFTGGNHLERFIRLMSLQCAGFHSRCMGPQKYIIRNVHRVLHIPGRMVIRQVQAFKIEIIRFDIGARDNGKSHTQE